MKYHVVDKEYRDFADDIEAVSIHYVCAPGGAEPDWDKDRVTRFMPLVEPGVRRLRLKLPAQLVDPQSGLPVSAYTLSYYFEVWRRQGGLLLVLLQPQRLSRMIALPRPRSER